MLLASLAIALPGRDVFAQQQQKEVDFLLAVVVNGRPVNVVGDFKQRDGQLYATPGELDALGLRIDKSALSTGEAEELPLSELAGVTYRLDEQSQTIYFTAISTALKQNVIDANNETAAQALQVESGLGAVANYTVVGTTVQGSRTQTEGLLDTRLFSPFGVVTSSFVGVSGASSSTEPFVRLDTTYAYSDPDTMRRYRMGDIITGGLAWTRPVRLGGIQATTDFSIRPDLVTFPVPTLSGAVAVPSSVDVLVNGVQLLSRDVTPGPFQVRQLPIVTGAGDVSVVVRNAVGQETIQTLPVYTSNLLLVRGMSAFSAEMGMLRLNYGVTSNDYHVPAGSLSFRHGVLDWLTLEAHGEGNAPGQTYAGFRVKESGMAGGGAVFTLGRLGVVSLEGAKSRSRARNGNLVSATYERTASIISLSASMQAASVGFSDIAAASGQSMPRLTTRGSIGLALGEFGSLGLAYVSLRGQATTVSQQASFYGQQSPTVGNGFTPLTLLPATNVSLASVSYSRSIFNQKASMYATAFHDFASTSSSGMLLGIALPLGLSRSAGANISDTGATFQLNQSVSEVGDIGGQVQDTTGRSSRQLAIADYKSPWGLVEAGIDHAAGQNAIRGTIQGSVAYAAGSLFASNTINDSFAVVDTDKTAGIQVLQENRPVGRTGASGQLLVPDLRSFDANRLGIDPTNVPLDVDIGSTVRMVRPQDHSGIVVYFPVHASVGALVQLVDALGQPLPVGSSASLEASEKAVVVGYEGKAFVKGLQSHNTLVVKLPNGGHCTAVFDYKPITGVLPEIGPVKCVQSAS